MVGDNLQQDRETKMARSDWRGGVQAMMGSHDTNLSQREVENCRIQMIPQIPRVSKDCSAYAPLPMVPARCTNPPK